MKFYFSISLEEDLLNSMLLKMDQIKFGSLTEEEIKKLAELIDEFAIFRIETHDEKTGVTHTDPKLSISAENKEFLKRCGINLVGEFVNLYLEDTRLILSNVHKYLKKKKLASELIMESISLKDKIRNNKDENERRAANHRIREIIKLLNTEQNSN